MKKIFTVVVLALTTLSMSAQEDSKFTYKAGIGLSSLVGDDADGCDSKFAYKIGATYDFNISDNFAIVPGAELVCKGWSEDGIDGDINTYSLQIPVLATYKFNVSENVKLVVKAGPYLSYGLFGSDIDVYDYYYGSYSFNVYDDDFCERLDAGIVAGVSANLGQFTVGLEFSRGLMKAVEDMKVYNQAYGVTVGYKF